MKLSEDVKKEIKEKWVKGDKVKYKDVLSRLIIDITEPSPFAAPWTFRHPTTSSHSIRNMLNSRNSLVGNKSLLSQKGNRLN